MAPTPSVLLWKWCVWLAVPRLCSESWDLNDSHNHHVRTHHGRTQHSQSHWELPSSRANSNTLNLNEWVLPLPRAKTIRILIPRFLTNEKAMMNIIFHFSTNEKTMMFVILRVSQRTKQQWWLSPSAHASRHFSTNEEAVMFVILRFSTLPNTRTSNDECHPLLLNEWRSNDVCHSPSSIKQWWMSSSALLTTSIYRYKTKIR